MSGRGPDLAVVSASVSDDSPDAGASFTLRATVRNAGAGRSSSATTLRYYRSSDATISASDTEVGADPVSGLAASGISAESISLTAPSSAGTYYFGACVDTVSGESDTANNCSDAVALTVLSGEGPGDTAPHFSDTVPAQTYTAGSVAQGLRLPAATGGDGALNYALAPAVPGLRFDATTRRLSGRPTQAGTYRMTYRAADADANTADSDAAMRTFTITVQAAGDFAPRMYGTVAARTYTAGTAIFALRLPTAYGGNGARTYTLTPVVPGLRFDAATRRLSGTPTQAGTYEMTYRAADADTNASDTDTAMRTFTIHVQAAGDFAPRMFGTIAPAPYTAGTAIAPLTLPRAYGGNGAVSYALAPEVSGLTFDPATRRLSGTPTRAGAYRMTYRAGDADANTGDSDAAIRAFTITVEAAAGDAVADLAVGSPSVSDASPDAGATFTLSATVRNQGSSPSAATTLRYFRSTDATISASDTAVGTDAVGSLAASGTSAESTSLTAPSSAGTYYYGACVDAVSGEADTANNCSSGIALTVQTAPAPAHDRAALVALYNATGGARWRHNTNWLSSAPLDQWYGVITDRSGRVTHLSLDNNRLSGRIPAALGSLSNLEWLYLSDNQLSGPIPAALGSLSNLHTMNLDNNRLSGPIPAALGRLSNLRQLLLYINQLSGPIPAALGSLSNLQALYIRENQLTGCIPNELRNVMHSDISSLGLRFCGDTTAPDLAVGSPSVSDSSPDAGASFTLSATVRNGGDDRSAATTLRYYRSTDATISASDTAVGTDAVGGLAASGTSAESIRLTAPSSAGTYYYGACVDAVSGEANPTDNCSSAASVTVIATQPPPADNACRVGMTLRPGDSCTYPDGIHVFSVDSSGGAKFDGRAVLITRPRGGTMDINYGSKPWEVVIVGGVRIRIGFLAKGQTDGTWLLEVVGD